MSEEGEKEGSGDKRKRLPGNEQTTEATKDDNVKQTSSTIRIKKTGRRRTSKLENIPEHHRFFPIACVAQLMRNALPPSAKVTQDAKECVQEIASEFILFISSEASDCCRADGRDVITYEDILEAMQALGFDNYVEPLSTYMKKYREAFPGKNKSLKLANFVPHLHNPNVNDSSGSTNQNSNFARKLVPLAPKTTALAGDTDLSNSVPEKPQNVHFMDTTTGEHSSQLPSPGETSQLIPIRPSTLIDSITNGQDQEAGEFTSQNGDCAPDSSPLAPRTTALAGDTNLSSSVPGVPQNVHFVDTTTGQLSSQMPSPGETSQLIPTRPSTVIDSITNGQNQEAGESTSQNGDCAPSSSPLAPQTTALTGDTNLSSSMPGVPQNVHFVDTTTGQLSSQMPSPGETSQLIPIRPSTVIDSIINGQNQEAGESTNQNSDFARKLVLLAPKTTALADDTDLSNSVPEVPQNIHFMDTTTGQLSSQMPSPGETSQLIPIRPSTVIDPITNGQNQEAGESTSQNGDCAPSSSPLAPKTTALTGDTVLNNSMPGVPAHVKFFEDTITGQQYLQLSSPDGTSELIPIRPPAATGSTAMPVLTLPLPNGQNQEMSESTSQNSACTPNLSSPAPETTTSSSDTNLSNSMSEVLQNLGSTSQLVPIRSSIVVGSTTAPVMIPPSANEQNQETSESTSWSSASTPNSGSLASETTTLSDDTNLSNSVPEVLQNVCFMDATTEQHYFQIPGPDGTSQLVPIRSFIMTGPTTVPVMIPPSANEQNQETSESTSWNSLSAPNSGFLAPETTTLSGDTNLSNSMPEVLTHIRFSEGTITGQQYLQIPAPDRTSQLLPVWSPTVTGSTDMPVMILPPPSGQNQETSESTSQNSACASNLSSLAPETTTLSDDTNLSNSVPEVLQNVRFMDTITEQHYFQIPGPDGTSQLVPIRPFIMTDSTTEPVMIPSSASGQNQETSESTSQDSAYAPNPSSVPEVSQNAYSMNATTKQHYFQMPSPGETSQLFPIRPSAATGSTTNGQKQEVNGSSNQNSGCAPNSSSLAPQFTALTGDTNISNSMSGALHFCNNGITLLSGAESQWSCATVPDSKTHNNVSLLSQ